MRKFIKASAVIISLLMFIVFTGCGKQDNAIESEAASAEKFSGKGYSFSYDTEKWVDSTELNELAGTEYESTNYVDIILESAEYPGNFIIITNNDVGKKGLFMADEIGPMYEQSVASDDRITYLGCKDVKVGGCSGVNVSTISNSSNKIDMLYFWHGTYQTMFTYDVESDLYDKLYPNLEQVLDTVDFD